MVNKKIIFYSILVYFFLRLFSYFFGSPTPLSDGSVVNTTFSVFLVIAVAYLLAKKDIRGWLIIAGELMLGGSGNILAIDSISVRTVLLVVSLFIFFIQTIQAKKIRQTFIDPISIPILFLLLWASISAIVGWRNNNEIGLIISDFIPYLFLLYYYPLKELIKKDDFKIFCLNILISAVLANALFIFITFILFNLEITTMQGSYYHWFRDIAQGKITYLSDGFYRLVLNEQLLVVPIAVYFIFQQIKQPKNINLVIIFALSFILALSLTRIYYLALVVSLFCLFSREYWKKWFKYSLLILISIFILFTGFYLFASRGMSLGWKYFGLRIGSIASPTIEQSSLSRMVLLPEIINKIKDSPVIGSGLGSTVTIFSPVYKETITTPHFDWGYLEIMAETGIIGFIAWIAMICYIFYLIKSDKNKKSPLIAVIVALLAINITSPAIFHVLGVVLIVIILARVSAQLSGEPIQNP